MLLGLGMDIEHIERFRRVRRARPNLIPPILSDREQALAESCEDPAVYLTCAFALKEAAFKAMRRTWTDSALFWMDVELLSLPEEYPPRLVLGGPATERQAEMGALRAHGVLQVMPKWVLAQIWMVGPGLPAPPA